MQELSENKTYNDDSRMLVELLLEDLAVLERDIGGEHATPSPSVIRTVITPILRRWVCDKDIMRLRNIIGTEITFPVFDHKQYVMACKAKQLITWIGMVGINEIYISPGLAADPSAPPTFAQDQQKTFDAKDFCQQKMAFLNGEFASRADIINFTANKLGGTHSPKIKEMKKHSLYKYMDGFGLAVLGSNIQIMSKGEFQKVEEYKKEGRIIYDLYFLVTLDTARRFVKGVQEIRPILFSYIQKAAI